MSDNFRTILILLFAFALGTVACALTTVLADEPQPARIGSTAGVYGPTLASAINTSLQGVTNPINDAVLRPAAQGVVASVHVSEGQFVKAGDPLLTMDDRIQRAATDVAQSLAEQTAGLESAELAVALAESVLQRTRTAVANSAASQFELKAKENQWRAAAAGRSAQRESVAVATAQLKLEQAKLDGLTIRAPFDGVVVQLFAQQGNTIDAESPAVRVAMCDELETEMHLPVELFGEIKPGQRYYLTASAPVNQTVTATVRYASSIIDPVSGTFRVVFLIPNLDHRFPAGFEVKLSGAVQTDNALTSVQH